MPVPSPAPAPLSCVLIDDHPAILRVVRTELEEHGIRVLGVETSVAGGRRMLAHLTPTAAVIDLSLNDGSGLALAEEAIAEHGTSVVLFTGEEVPRALVEQALGVGVRGILCKDSPLEDLRRAIAAAAAGKVYIDAALGIQLVDRHPVRLSGRELSVLEGLAEGQSYDEIAADLGIANETVRSHASHAIAKLGGTTRTGAVASALRQKLIA